MLFDVSTARLYGLLSRLFAKPVVCVTPATVFPVAFQLARKAVVVGFVALLLLIVEIVEIVVVVVERNQKVTTSARPSPQSKAPSRKPPTTINGAGQARISALGTKKTSAPHPPRQRSYAFFLISVVQLCMTELK